MLQIHERIKKERLKAGLTEEEIAGRIGIKRSTYQYWEVKTPHTDKIKSVAKALNLPEDYFFVTADESRPNTREGHLESASNQGLSAEGVTYTLQDYIDKIEQHNAFLQEMIRASLGNLETKLDSLHRHDRAYHETILRTLAPAKSRKDADSLIEEADNREYDLLQTEKRKGTVKVGK